MRYLDLWILGLNFSLSRSTMKGGLHSSGGLILQMPNFSAIGRIFSM